MNKQRIGIALAELKTRTLGLTRNLAQNMARVAGRPSFRRYGAFVLLAVFVTSTAAVAAAQALRPELALGSEVAATPLPAVVASMASTTSDTASSSATSPETAVRPDGTIDANAAARANGVPVVAPVGPNSGIRLTQQDIDLLAHIINGEARGEPFKGQVAVGAVVLNRVRAGGSFGSTVAQVVYDPGQFEPVQNGQIDLKPTASSYQAALAAAQGQDPTNGALYFFMPDQVSNAYLWSRPFHVQIGAHRFTG